MSLRPTKSDEALWGSQFWLQPAFSRPSAGASTRGHNKA